MLVESRRLNYYDLAVICLLFVWTILSSLLITMPRCKGCNTTFASRGYANHIQQAHQPACRAIFDEQNSYVPGVSERSQSTNTTTPFEYDHHNSNYDKDNLGPADDETDSDEDDLQQSGAGNNWEPESEPGSPTCGDDDYMDDSPPSDPSPEGSQSAEEHRAAQDRLRSSRITIERFGGRAGAILRHNVDSESGYSTYEGSDELNPWAPFKTQLDWEVARWSKLRGPGSTATSELLGINGVCGSQRIHIVILKRCNSDKVTESLGLSYKNSEELNKIIDTQIPSERPRFNRKEVEMGGETFEIYYRDVLECTRALFGDPEFADDLVFAPERHYTDSTKQIRVYSEMHTGSWWWDRQVRKQFPYITYLLTSVKKKLEKDCPGATIVPLLLSTDKTLVTLFGNKSAYPVYMTIGNLPKEIRRKPSQQSHVLLGYLPTTRLTHISNKSSRRRMLANLFHGCMSKILEPIKAVGKTGVEMTSGDGVTRRVHPLFACFVGDYPEQVLASGCKTGECPKCDVPHESLGEYPTTYPLRDLGKVLEALEKLDSEPDKFIAACGEAGVKPIMHPFWLDLPYADIHLAITPDILHQLYQGVIKHVVAWIISAYGEKEIDARCRRLPPNHNIRLFSKGISSLSRVTGKEHADMCRIILGLVIDLRLPGNYSPF